MKHTIRLLVLAGLLTALAGFVLAEGPEDAFAQQIHRQLVMLPFYGIFDNIDFAIHRDGSIELLGQVSRPSLRVDAERIVADVEGVTGVVNNIEVLPHSTHDDRIRLAAYRVLSGDPRLRSCVACSVPLIRIIVRHGEVTLEGAVSSEIEKSVARVLIAGLDGVSSVDNRLEVMGS
jgi:hyperosmotically inducible protein